MEGHNARSATQTGTRPASKSQIPVQNTMSYRLVLAGQLKSILPDIGRCARHRIYEEISQPAVPFVWFAGGSSCVADRRRFQLCRKNLHACNVCFRHQGGTSVKSEPPGPSRLSNPYCAENSGMPVALTSPQVRQEAE